MPRSGTSWLGQIFDSSPDVAFRMEPLFSYSFKNVINDRSSNEDIHEFFNQVYLTDDEFIHQKESRTKGVYSYFEKNQSPTYLVIKTTRHHNLLERYLRLIDCIEILAIIRHPCAAISSWISTEREFGAKGCKVEKDWRSGECRKDDDGEYWGFDDWLSVTHKHLALAQKYRNFNIVKYANLVHGLEDVTRQLFERLSIPYTRQTLDFLKKSQSRHDDDPYSVFKGTDVESKWKTKLSTAIAQEITRETNESGLGEFLE
jgi:hypothetical protein